MISAMSSRGRCTRHTMRAQESLFVYDSAAARLAEPSERRVGRRWAAS
jgi:hypothetical protein